MRKKLLSILFCASLICLGKNARAAEEVVEEFTAYLDVNQTGEIYVTETIKYNFGTNKKHGIYRDIQDTFENNEGKKFRTPLKIISVKDQDGRNYSYTTSRNTDNTRLKIGDADKYVSGLKVYQINYIATGALEGFSDHDELFWNITGNKWQVPILKTTAFVKFPEEIIIDSICYTGAYGSSAQNCTINEISKSQLRFSVPTTLYPGEGISSAVSFESGVINITPKQMLKSTPEWIKVLILILGILYYVGVPLAIIFYYLKFGRDPKNPYKTIPVLFDPPKEEDRRLSPAEVGTILDETVNNRDITATLVDLAIRGHIKITEIEEDGLIKKVLNQKDYMLIKSDNYKTKDRYSLLAHESDLTSKIFGEKDSVKTSDLKDKFYKKAEEIKKDMYQNVVDLGYFPKNPNKVRTTWYIIGFIALFTANAVAGIVAILLAKAMPRKTIKGTKKRVEALALKKFLSSQERQLEFQEKNWYMFEKLLPYAIAFDVTKTWAKRFEDMQVSNVDWYGGAHSFNPVIFANSIDSFGNNMNSVSTPQSSSGGYSSGFSGGGFSGGGFGGGGGGGSW